MKATFQKPDATYPHGSLREQAMNFIEKLQSDSRKELHFHEENLVNWLVDFYESVAVPIVQETEYDLWCDVIEIVLENDYESKAWLVKTLSQKFENIQRRKQ